MEATAFLQDWLDRMGDATLRGDWQGYATGIRLPFRLLTEAAEITVATEAELKRGFERFVASLHSQQVTDYIRLVTSATLADNRLDGTYVTHVLAQSVRVLPRFESAITLHRDGTAWRATIISNTLNNDRWPIDMPGVTPRL
jgi:hypothetical protein